MRPVSVFHRDPISSAPRTRSEVDSGFIGVVAGCSQYPNPNILPDEERILQEISEGNTTDLEP